MALLFLKQKLFPSQDRKWKKGSGEYTVSDFVEQSY